MRHIATVIRMATRAAVVSPSVAIIVGARARGAPAARVAGVFVAVMVVIVVIERSGFVLVVGLGIFCRGSAS